MAIQKIQIQAMIAWQARRSEASNRWIGVADALNLAIEADSLDELHSLIPETIHLLLTDLLQDNELDRFLRERGWQAQNLPARVPDIADVEFELPWHLIAEGARDPERRAY